MFNWDLPRLATHPRIYNWLHTLRLVPEFTTTRPTELACLEDHAKGAKIAVVVGSYMGASAGRIASVLGSGGKCYCVDPYIRAEAMQAVCLRHLRRAGLMPRIVMLRMTGGEARLILPRQVDFIFVDGDHSWDGIRTDWALVKECLRLGGKVCFHDTSPPPERPTERCESVRFFDEVISQDAAFEQVETRATLNVLRRR